MNREHKVDEYIEGSPPETRRNLRVLRQIIRGAQPRAVEVFSYRMPGYCYPGYEYKGMFAWFGLQSHHIGLYVRPPTIGNHRRDLKGYGTTKSAVHLPIDEEVPAHLVRKLVRTSVRIMQQRGRSRRPPHER